MRSIRGFAVLFLLDEMPKVLFDFADPCHLLRKKVQNIEKYPRLVESGLGVAHAFARNAHPGRPDEKKTPKGDLLVAKSAK